MHAVFIVAVVPGGSKGSRDQFRRILPLPSKSLLLRTHSTLSVSASLATPCHLYWSRSAKKRLPPTIAFTRSMRILLSCNLSGRSINRYLSLPISGVGHGMSIRLLPAPAQNGHISSRRTAITAAGRSTLDVQTCIFSLLSIGPLGKLPPVSISEIESERSFCQ